jgi:hypothetical protein
MIRPVCLAAINFPVGLTASATAFVRYGAEIDLRVRGGDV